MKGRIASTSFTKMPATRIPFQLCRTVPYELLSEKVSYDKSKYYELVFGAAETVLGPQDFLEIF